MHTGGPGSNWASTHIPRVLSGLLLSLVSSKQFVAVLATEIRDDRVAFRTMLEDSISKPVRDRTYPLAEAGEAFG